MVPAFFLAALLRLFKYTRLHYETMEMQVQNAKNRGIFTYPSQLVARSSNKASPLFHPHQPEIMAILARLFPLRPEGYWEKIRAVYGPMERVLLWDIPSQGRPSPWSIGLPILPKSVQ